MLERKFILVFVISITLFLNINCSASRHTLELHSTKERELTVGVVQKEIHKGMDQAEVASNLGSPNIVTKDTNGFDTWIYDKIASEASYSNSGGYGTLLLLGFSKNAGASSTTQKTLTVIIKFNEKNLVESFSYHTSKF